MKKIDANELYRNLSGFLLAKGVELKEGAYSQRIRRGCDVLTNVINTTQNTVQRARVTVDRRLDRLRQSIHQATAPKPPGAAGAQTTPSAARASKRAAKTGTKPSRTRKLK